MVLANFDFELQHWARGLKLICGLDEVGRGCFAGPVVAAGVIFPPNIDLNFQLADSKLLTPKARLELEPLIKQTALAWSIAEVSVEVINQIGIGKATDQAFCEVVSLLPVLPERLLIDAFFIQGLDKSTQQPLKEGDSLCASIAAASIIAKVYRDRLMEQLALKYPQYQFAVNKGYGTKSHRQAIHEHGLSEIHRTSFNLTKFL